MSTYAEGTIVQSTVTELVKYQYAPRGVHDERPWRAVDAPAILVMVLGDENDEVRFKDEDIQENIDAGELEVIYTM